MSDSPFKLAKEAAGLSLLFATLALFMVLVFAIGAAFRLLTLPMRIVARWRRAATRG